MRKVTVISIIAIHLMINPHLAQGATIVVGSEEGCDFSKIGKAMRKAQPGDVIEVRPGLYKEKISMRDGVTLKGAEPDKTKVCHWETVFEAKNINQGRVTGICFEQSRNRSLFVPVVIKNCGKDFQFIENVVSQPAFNPDNLIPKSGWISPQEQTVKGSSKYGEDIAVEYGSACVMQNETSRGIYLLSDGGNAPVVKNYFVSPFTNECLPEEDGRYPLEVYTRVPFAGVERHYYTSTANGKVDVNIGKMLASTIREFFFTSFDQAIFVEVKRDGSGFKVNKNSIIAIPTLQSSDGRIAGRTVEATLKFVVHFSTPEQDQSFEVSGTGKGSSPYDPGTQTVLFGMDLEASARFAKAFEQAAAEAFEDFQRNLKKSEVLDTLIRHCAYVEMTMANNPKLADAYIRKYPNSDYAEKIKDQRDEVVYKLAREKNTLEAYDRFIKGNPDNRYVKEAEKQILQLKYEEAKGRDSVEAFNAFLAEYPNSQYSSEIRQRIAQLAYEKDKKLFAGVEASGDIDRFEDFIRNHPNSAFTPKAKEKIAEFRLKRDRELFERACEANTVEAYHNFINSYPQSVFVPEARQRMKRLQKFGITRCRTSTTGKHNIDLKAEANFFSSTLGVIDCNQTVEILKRQNDWYLILTEDGKQGYVYVDNLQE